MATAPIVDVPLPQLYAHYGRTLIVRPHALESPDELFEQICRDFRNTKIEQDANGDVRIMAPAGGESSTQNSDIVADLTIWSRQDRRGRVFDSSAAFRLPDGSILGPDAAWVTKKNLSTLTRAELTKFPRLVPDFIIELKSESDSIAELQRKMQSWQQNGVALGWLIIPDKRQVFIYRQHEAKPELVSASASLAADGIAQGFVLNLEPIWQGFSDLEQS